MSDSLKNLLLEAFPIDLHPSLERLAHILLPPSDTQNITTILIGCGDRILYIPHRIYSHVPTEEQLQYLAESDRVIVCCWFTRHHDGHIREKFLRKLQTYDQEWIMVYVMLLCSEYVIEILNYIWQNRERFNQVVLGCWYDRNMVFGWWVRERAISYWNCYYRAEFPEFEAYVGSRLLEFFQQCGTAYQQTKVLPEATS